MPRTSRVIVLCLAVVVNGIGCATDPEALRDATARDLRRDLVVATNRYELYATRKIDGAKLRDWVAVDGARIRDEFDDPGALGLLIAIEPGDEATIASFIVPEGGQLRLPVAASARSYCIDWGDLGSGGFALSRKGLLASNLSALDRMRFDYVVFVPTDEYFDARYDAWKANEAKTRSEHAYRDFAERVYVWSLLPWYWTILREYRSIDRRLMRIECHEVLASAIVDAVERTASPDVATRIHQRWMQAIEKCDREWKSIYDSRPSPYPP